MVRAFSLVCLRLKNLCNSLEIFIFATRLTLNVTEIRKEKKMATIEIIGACVGIVATVLGGVWFIVNKAFGVGRFSHRIDEV